MDIVYYETDLDDVQVVIKPGERSVSDMSDIEREVLLTDIVQRILDHKYFFDEIGAMYLIVL